MDEKTLKNREYAKASMEELHTLIATLKAENNLLKMMLFGSKKETAASHDPIGMTCLFNEFEQLKDDIEVVSEENKASLEQTPASGPQKKPRGKRKPLPKSLPRVRQEFDLPEEEKFCKVHLVALTKIGEQITEKLDIVPARAQVIEQVTFTYKCPCCEDRFCKSKKDLELLPKSMATAGLLAYIATAKYEDALPLYRQEKIFNRFGIELDRTTMARWMIKVATLAQPLINLLHDHLMEKSVIHCDETVLQVLKEDHRRAESKSYIWALASKGPQPAILFSYYETRAFKSASDLLSGYKGYVVCDGYKVYDKLSKAEVLILCGCLAHCRRKFWQAEKQANKEVKKGSRVLAAEAMLMIRKLYAIEKFIKDRLPDEIYKIRQEQSLPILREFHIWLQNTATVVLPKSLTGKAISYALNQWDKLIRYCDDGLIPIDNNYMEAHIRPFVIGRKNWLFSDTPSGAHASVAIYSLVESAKANGVQAFDYLSLIFKELPKAKTIEDYEKLLPFNAVKYFPLNTYNAAK